MKILAIESSGQVASAAIYADGDILIEKKGPFKVTHSETLLPMIAEAVSETGITLESLDAIAVSGGPGSFTGLRIGSATAKGLGLALDKKLIHVPTLDGMAYNFKGEPGLIVPIMDARRSQTYTGIYRFEGNQLKVHMAGDAMAIEDLIGKLNAENPNETVTFLGDGVPVFKGIIEEKASFKYAFAEEGKLLQSAASVAELAAVLYEEGKLISADDEAPEYLRQSQAERVRAEGGAN